MKTKEEIEKALRGAANCEGMYPAMSYELGVEEALQWVLDEIPDDEFAPLEHV